LTKNEVVLDEEEIPTKDSLNYLLETGEAVMEEEKKEVADKETPIIFCIDISGSMARGPKRKPKQQKQEPLWKRGLNKKQTPL